MTRVRNGLVALALLALAAPAQAYIGLEAGGGVADYTRGLDSGSSAGPAWSASLQLMPTSVVGVELAYTGSSIPFEGAGSIVQNGGDALLRLNLATGLVRPFAFAGVGASRISGEAGTPHADDETVFQVPAGAGLELSAGPVAIAGRFRWNFQFETDVSPRQTVATGTTPSREGFDRWSTMLTLGVRM